MAINAIAIPATASVDSRSPMAAAAPTGRITAQTAVVGATIAMVPMASPR